MRYYLLPVALLLLFFSGSIYFNFLHKTPTLRIRDSTFSLETADTQEKREQGLSGRGFIENNQAMLFVFESDGPQCMWMKDMNFSIDMIWLDAQKKVVHLEDDVSPDTYPRSFCSPLPARYVVEVKKGTIARDGVQVGQNLGF